MKYRRNYCIPTSSPATVTTENTFTIPMMSVEDLKAARCRWPHRLGDLRGSKKLQCSEAHKDLLPVHRSLNKRDLLLL